MSLSLRLPSTIHLVQVLLVGRTFWLCGTARESYVSIEHTYRETGGDVDGPSHVVKRCKEYLNTGSHLVLQVPTNVALIRRYMVLPLVFK